jgi:hypothetical protein
LLLFVDLNIFIALFMLSSLFIALFICFELFIALICRSEYIYCFIHVYYVFVNICVVIIPSPCVLVRQNPSGFGGVRKPSLRP